MESAKHRPGYHLSDTGEFVITDYNYAKPLANFFPGIAGTHGVPMWVFYVNRGQAISSFGTDGKDSAILEFEPANKAFQMTSQLGFRTFIKGKKGTKSFFYEPFHNGLANREFRLENSLSMSAGGLTLLEKNTTLGLEISVKYFSIPQDSFAALARVVRIRNTGRSSLSFHILDGLPQIVPYGENNWCLKEISRTIEAWHRIENLEKGVPVYRLSVDPGDRPQVVHIEKGNFYLGFTADGARSRIIKPIVDPDSIFGSLTDFSAPRNFIGASWKEYPAYQQVESKTPCGFLPLSLSLRPGEEKGFNAVIGTVRKTEMLDGICRRVIAPGYLEAKARENTELLDGLTASCATSSSHSAFDLYCRQTYLDNILRGGTPVVFSNGDKRKVFYLYSRKHGDLERDYNRFQIQDTYFSQGNGNYRDINQNRRCDVWFNPAIGDFNLELFINLIQTDGYNPLVVKGSRFVLTDADGFAAAVKGLCAPSVADGLLALVKKPFTPGEVFLYLEEHKVGDPARVLDILLPSCDGINEAEHGEGYWIDHWHYNLDLLESYLGVYPEQRHALFFGKKEFTYFDNDAVVLPRHSKYCLLDGMPRQLHAVSHDAEKRQLIGARHEHKHLSRIVHGKGEILKTTLFAKLVCVFVNKYSSLDPFGTGIEMEADKPNWYDALNGLPALFGSSASESFELKRLALLLAEAAGSNNAAIALPEEVAEFFTALSSLSSDYEAGSVDDLGFWKKSGALKEEYRRKTKFGFSGADTMVDSAGIVAGCRKALKKIEAGLARAFDRKTGLYCGYFINEVTAYEKLSGNAIMPTAFIQKRLPYFLEGQMHAARTCERAAVAPLYAAVRKSALYDTKLKMYKVTAPLAAMPEEIGRCRVFTPGWLENESIFLHMEYKYLLELLKRGLYEEFFADFQNVLIPFQKPAVYGRSVLENSSFIASSAFPYPRLHGNGFVARLSGSTAEFVQMWLVMNAGLAPFALDGAGKLTLTLAPVLPGWMFRKKDKKYAFRFLGSVDVTYVNPSLKDTFGKAGCRVARMTLTDKTGKVTALQSGVIPAPLAQRARSGEITKIEAVLE